MYSLKTRTDEVQTVPRSEPKGKPVARSYVSPGRQGQGQAIQRRPVRATRRQVRPFALPMGPVTLTICSVLLIGLMAVLYLSQQAQAVSANQQLQSMRDEQSQLTRQNQDFMDQIATAQSPAHIAAQATRMGMIQADPAKVQIIKIHNLQPIPDDEP